MLSHGVQGWRSSQHCSGVVTGHQRSLTYLSGDALTDSRDCLGPGGQRYPHEEVDKFVRQQSGVRGGSSRQGRAMNLGNLSLYLPESISRRKAYNWVTYYRILVCLKAILPVEKLKLVATIILNVSATPGTVDPWETQKTLLSAHKMTRDGLIRKRRDAEDDDDEPQCTIGGAPPRLCK